MRIALAVLCVLAVALPAHAQFEGLVGGITDLTIHASCWRAPNTTTNCLRGESFGLELMWRLREIPIGGTSRATKRQRLTPATRTVRRDSSGTVVFVDTTQTFSEVPVAGDAKAYLLVELALSYSQFAGLQSNDPSYELRGTAREFPALTVYGSLSGAVPFVTPYVGIRSGIIDIQNFQAVDNLTADNATVYAAAPRAFQLGGILGVSLCNCLVSPRIEYSYNVRQFPSLQWAPGTPPNRLPRSLSFSGWSLAIGLQFSLRDMK